MKYHSIPVNSSSLFTRGQRLPVIILIYMLISLGLMAQDFPKAHDSFKTCK